jgi:glycine oxidase
MVLFHAGARPFRPIILHGPRYLVPRGDGRVLAGSTEEDVGFDRSTTTDGTEELRSFALRIAPCLSRATIETTWAGLRPATPDGLPYLGLVPGVSNLFVAAGHFRSGIQMSPATGKLLTEAMMSKPNRVLDAFAVDRSTAASLH